MTAAERLCTDTYSITGNFTIGQQSPDNQNNETGEPGADGEPDIQGCWPTGKWVFTLARSGGDCTPGPSIPSSIEFDVIFNADPIEPDFTEMLLEPTVDDYRLHVSQGGGGLCEGGLELFTKGGTEVFNLQPTLNVFNVSGPLAGVGEFSRFSKNQVPETE